MGSDGAVTGSPSRPVILDRRRIEVAEMPLSGPVQPYHTARDSRRRPRRVFLEECREASKTLGLRIVG